MKYLIAIGVLCGLAACSRVNETNVVQSYEWFHSAYTQVQAKQSQIASFRNQSQNDKTVIELEGMKQSCFNLVAEYNAKASMITRGGLALPPSLPVRIDSGVCQ